MGRRSDSSAPAEANPTIDLVGVQGVILRRDPTRLGGVCTVCLVIAGKEVELIRQTGDLVDHMVWPLGMRQTLKKAGIA